jgi:CRP/FNR family transcriptional regulator
MRVINADSFDRTPDHCDNCALLAWSQSSGLTEVDLARFNRLITHRRPIKTGTYVTHAGSPLESLYVVHSGFLKTTSGNESGLEQITGFLMPGDLVGMCGIASGQHQCNTVAIEDSTVCGISFSQLEQLCGKHPELQRHFHTLLSTEINRDHRLMLLLGIMHAEERLALFLLEFSTRFTARGESPTLLRLPMKHQEIASYLGLSLETISRLLTRLSGDGLIAVDHKYIEIKTVEGLKRIAGNAGNAARRRIRIVSSRSEI